MRKERKVIQDKIDMLYMGLELDELLGELPHWVYEKTEEEAEELRRQLLFTYDYDTRERMMCECEPMFSLSQNV